MQKFLEKREALSFSLFEKPRKKSFLKTFQNDTERYFLLPDGKKHGQHIKEHGEDKETKLWKNGVLHGEWKREKKRYCIRGNFVDGRLEGKVTVKAPYYRENLCVFYKDGFPIVCESPEFKTEFFWDIPNKTLVVTRKDDGHKKPILRKYSDISFREEEDKTLSKGIYLSSFSCFDDLMTSNGSRAVVGKSSDYDVSICFPVFPN
uniref:MORN repeat-containing protein n=1 Tax=Marseillevirus sp. TaxID=2809551 RepID=A0AA96EMB5_9VIRU|nr:hypothetical protein MarQu_115 [Marseillevirus sp.]WNL50239.1 hypothetical protein MarDSR_200 [Marseillevirus sp.]